MSDRTDTRDSTARAAEAEAPIDEVVAATFVDEDEEQNEKIEAAIEAELEIEDQAAINERAVLDVLLRRSGVLPEQTEIDVLDEEDELPAGRRNGEFVCSTCFLIKPNSQMGDADRRVCHDCVDPPQAKHVA